MDDPQLQYIKVSVAQLNATVNGTAIEIDIPFEADFMILPPATATPPGIGINGNQAAIYNVQINDPQSGVLMFGIFPTTGGVPNPGFICAFVGRIRKFFIAFNPASVGSPTDVWFLVGKNCKIGTASQIFHT